MLVLTVDVTLHFITGHCVLDVDQTADEDEERHEVEGHVSYCRHELSSV